MMNWSKRDYNLDALATGNQVFNRVITAVDPSVFKQSGKDFTVVDSQNGGMHYNSKLIKTDTSSTMNQALAYYQSKLDKLGVKSPGGT